MPRTTRGVAAIGFLKQSGEVMTMSYYIAKKFDGPFDKAIATVTERLKAQGFGVLSDIDVQGTLKAKIAAEIPKYRILGACNPSFAHEALKLEDKLGVLLPCNVIVRETADGKVEVASVDPVVAMERTGNPALAATAEEVRRRLAIVVGV
jgi:uncharacterized protein (DUF302 family)